MTEVRINLSNGRTLEWEGDRAAGLLVINAIESAAVNNGETFDTLTKSCIEHALHNTDEGEGEISGLGILAFVLQMNLDHGRLVDLLDAATTEFKFDIVGGEESFNVHAYVRGRFHS
jgi:hypothetical protein